MSYLRGTLLRGRELVSFLLLFRFSAADSLLFFFFFFLMIRRPPRSPLFPSPTLFRSRNAPAHVRVGVVFRGNAVGRPAGERDAEVPRQAVLVRQPRELGHPAGAAAAASAFRSPPRRDRKSTRLNSSHDQISYAVFCLK